MSFWAYMLHCRGGYYYVGHTDDLERRLADHQHGTVPGFATNHRPVELVWSEVFATRDEARAADARVKGWSRAKKRALIRGDWADISNLAKSKGATSEAEKGSPSTGSGQAAYGESDELLESVRPELVEGLSLFFHPSRPPHASLALTANLAATPNSITLRFTLTGATASLRIPPPAPPARTDGLWRTTCFELFLRNADGSYVEFNLSPSGQWAAYAFDGYRTGQRDLPLPTPPRIETMVWEGKLSIQAFLEWPRGDAVSASLTAVIEEVDGTLSYWALEHPEGRPDFHRDDCFALMLRAPPAP